MTKPKRKRNPRRLATLLKAVRQENIHPELGLKKSVYSLSVESSRMKQLKRLARERGTTVEQEVGNAIDTYLLDLPPSDVRMLNTMLDRFKATMDKNNRTLDETLRVIEKSNARLARLKRFRLKLPR